MNYTGYTFNGKPLASLSVGCMRFPSRQAAVDTIRACVPHDVLYLDTSPMYCYQSEEENCETWVGEAIRDIREKVILSAKCSPGNGGNEIGEYDPAKGFSINTADKVRRQIEQSLRRLQVDRFDCYQMWAVHVPLVFDEGMKPGGWMEGVLKAKEEGLFKHLGITGHADATEIKRWIDTELFEMITIPFQMLDTSRLEAVRYAREKGVAVIAMNPLAGGLLAGESQMVVDELRAYEVSSTADMALRFGSSFPGVSVLAGMTSAQEAAENVASLSKPSWDEKTAEEVKQRFNGLLGKAKHICTACNYCAPCPQGLLIPEILKLRNYHLVLKLESAKTGFRDRYKWWGDSHKADRCTACGSCESKCPNSLPVSQLMKEVMELFGPFEG